MDVPYRVIALAILVIAAWVLQEIAQRGWLGDKGSVSLTVGVLIIGSLAWRNGGRGRWRRLRLAGHGCPVSAPIEYGRLSKNGTYTMVFSDRPEARPGRAIVVKCRRTVKSSSDLIAEAEWLWAAEESTDKLDRVPRSRSFSPEHRIAPKNANWGCVALLNNPRSTMPAALLDDWAEHVARQPHYNANKLRLVDRRGMLQIEWPTLLSSGAPVQMDLLLSTSNDRELTYPTAQQIADVWSSHPEVDYFRKNRQNGIETFRDGEIAKLLGANRP